MCTGKHATQGNGHSTRKHGEGWIPLATLTEPVFPHDEDLICYLHYRSTVWQVLVCMADRIAALSVLLCFIPWQVILFCANVS